MKSDEHGAASDLAYQNFKVICCKSIPTFSQVVPTQMIVSHDLLGF